LISFCGKEITEPDVLSMFGLAARSQILALAAAVLGGETEKALRLLNDLAQQGKDIGRLVSELLGHFRNLLIFQVSHGDLALVEASEAEAAALREQSPRLRPDALIRVLEVLTDCEGRLRDTASKKILVEVALLKMIEARDAVSIDTVLKQLQELRAGAPPAPRPAAVAAPPAAPAASAPPAVAQALSAPPEAAGLPGLWEALKEAVGRASPFVKTYFLEAHPVSFDKNVLTIGFDPEFADHLPLVDNVRNVALVRTKLAELGHPNAQVKFVQADAPPRQSDAAAPAASEPVRPGPEPARTPAEDFKNDPLIQKALEIFKGQIAEVRS
jgi:DNA polymerase-3 subunit gamma/tau